MSKKATQERIAEASLSILEKEGPSAVSMRRVADTAGITAMAIYHHFQNKEALLDFVTEREFAKFLEYLEKRPQRGAIGVRLVGAMQAYVDYSFDRPRIFDYVFAEARLGARRYPEDFRARRYPTLNPIADLVAKGMESGYLKKDDVWEVALELWAHTHGYVALYRAGRFTLRQEDFCSLVQRSLKRLIRGLKA